MIVGYGIDIIETYRIKRNVEGKYRDRFLNRIYTENEIEVYHEKSGKPHINLHGRSKEIAEELGVDNIAVSMSHLKEIVIASVIFENTRGV